jgi:outer membrane protein assembly factor BamD
MPASGSSARFGGSFFKSGLVRAAFKTATLGFFALALSGCFMFGPGKIVEEEIVPVTELYDSAIENVNKQSYKTALEEFQKLDRQHPYSEYAEKSKLMQVFIYFRTKKLDEAILAADRYLALYPSSEDAAYAMYLKGSSYYGRIRDITRDQRDAQDAIDTYQQLIANYPGSEYAADARTKILLAEDQLAGKEMSVGRYYLGNGQYTAAINRFKVVVEEHEESTHVEEALMRLTEAYLKLGLTNEARNAAAVLGLNYPASQWYQDAYSLLQSQNLTPQAQAGNSLGASL